MKIEQLVKKYVFLDDENNEFIQNIDFSKNSVAEVANAVYSSKDSSNLNNEKLHNYIFKFYAYNEIISSYKEKNNGIIAKKDLKIFKEYADFVNKFSKKIFSFILNACISEARHSEIFQEIEIHAYNDNYNEQIRKAYASDAIKDFKQGNPPESFNHFLSKLLKNTNQEYYDNVIKQHSKLEKLFLIELIKNNVIYSEFSEDFQYSFNKKFLTNYFKKFPYRIKNDINTFFNTKYTNIGEAIDLEKSRRFEEFGNFLVDIHRTQMDGGDGELQRKIIKSKMIEKSTIKDLTIEEILDFLSVLFKRNFDNKESYGGEPWSDIANHALSFARGEINAEIFIDQALSMEHNNGNMFNKNFIFENSRDGTYIYYFLKNSNYESYIGLNHNFYININEFMLTLQSSCSVLSLNCFEKTKFTWESLTHSLQDEKKISQYNLQILKQNFDSFTAIHNNIIDFKKMTSIAETMGYTIPKLNFKSFVQVFLEKEEHLNSNLIIKENLESNNLLEKIIDEKYLNKKKETQLFFKLHDLNSNYSKKLSKQLIGGKAHGLVNLINKGFNVPKALVFDTKTCLSYIEDKEYFSEKYKRIDKKISDYLINDNKHPLLVSVRSGAAVSMPGMMDSILNIGIDDSTYEPLCKNYGKEVIDQCSISFMNQFCNSKLNLEICLPKNINQALKDFAQILTDYNVNFNKENLFPLSKEQQIKLSVEAVFDSWNSPRAIAWRNQKNIDHNLGTAATVQEMVFGNKNDNSFTCVIFSRDCITGKSEIMGEYLQKAQGEDLVSGKRTPFPISELKISNPKVYQEIKFIAKTLEEDQKAIQDIEITVEDGKVYVLQMRNAVISSEAQLALTKDMGLNVLDVIETQNLIGEAKVDTLLEADYQGLVGSPGLMSGIIVRNQKEIEKYKPEGKDLIFFSNQALPENAPIMIATQGFITEVGGATSHAAILARSMRKPCVVGIGVQNSEILKSGSIITVDAREGKIWKGELPIVINQDNAINLSYQILRENKIEISEKIFENKLNFKSWTTSLSSYKVLEQPINNKHKMFLNIAQQTALVLQMEHKHKREIKSSINNSKNYSI